MRGHLLVPRASAAASFPLPPLVLCQSQPVTTLHARLHAVHSGQLTRSPAVQYNSTRGERVPFALTLSLNPSPSVSSALEQAASSDWRLDMANAPTSRVPALHCTSARVRVVVTRRTGTAARTGQCWSGSDPSQIPEAEAGRGIPPGPVPGLLSSSGNKKARSMAAT